MDVPAPSSERQSATIWVIALAAFWLASAVGGLYITWAYENGPGVAATAGPQWPGETSLIAATDRPTLVFLAHPQCTCTTASLGELAEALARAKQLPKTYVVFLKPSSMPDGWEKTDLWHAAESLPMLLYGSNRSFLFNGGITGSRGHAGENAGRASIVNLLNHVSPVTTATNVFGCSLFAAKKS